MSCSLKTPPTSAHSRLSARMRLRSSRNLRRQGIQPEALRTAIARAPRRPKFLYVIPNFQNRRARVSRPSGARKSCESRPSTTCSSSRTIPTDALLRRLPQPALVAASDGAPWVYLGTTSKDPRPGLRVRGSCRRQASLIEKIVTANRRPTCTLRP